MANLGDLLRDVPPHKLDQPCSDEHLRDIALSITEWQTIAPFLELSEVDEEGIKCKYPHLLIRQNLGMLRRWRESFGSRATYRKLAEGFWRVGKGCSSRTNLYFTRGKGRYARGIVVVSYGPAFF